MKLNMWFDDKTYDYRLRYLLTAFETIVYAINELKRDRLYFNNKPVKYLEANDDYFIVKATNNNDIWDIEFTPLVNETINKISFNAITSRNNDIC